MGDRSLVSPHFGCQLVGHTFREQFARTGMHLIASLSTDATSLQTARQWFDQADLVVVNGEGSTHHGRCSHFIRLAESWPCALVNCVYQDNLPLPELLRFQYITARESLSTQAIRAHGANCDTVPDVIFASSLLSSYVNLQGPPVKKIGVTDNARKTAYRLGLFRWRFRPGPSPKSPMVTPYLGFLARHQRLCCGRFHAAVAAAVLRIPFSTWDSNTWKIEGMMSDMGLPHLHFRCRNDALRAVPADFDPRIDSFVSQARDAIHRMFDRLAQIARENMAASARAA